MKKGERERKLFLKSMVYTAAAIALLAIGYFTAEYFFRGLI